MVRLGAESLRTGVIPRETIDRTLAILRAFQRLARLHKVEEIVAVATSAVREAKNGEDVLELIGRRIGIHPRAISGEEEAALIYTAALHSMHLEGRRTLVVDIGGGSVELVVGKGASIVHKTSLKLGVLRLTQEFFRTDPISARAERKLKSTSRTCSSRSPPRSSGRVSSVSSERRARSWRSVAPRCRRSPRARGRTPCTTPPCAPTTCGCCARSSSPSTCAGA